MNNDRFALLEGLLGEAFARLGQATPTVVSVKPPEEGGETSASYAMPFSWPNPDSSLARRHRVRCIRSVGGWPGPSRPPVDPAPGAQASA